MGLDVRVMEVRLGAVEIVRYVFRSVCQLFGYSVSDATIDAAVLIFAIFLVLSWIVTILLLWKKIRELADWAREVWTGKPSEWEIERHQKITKIINEKLQDAGTKGNLDDLEASSSAEDQQAKIYGDHLKSWLKMAQSGDPAAANLLRSIEAKDYAQAAEIWAQEAARQEAEGKIQNARTAQTYRELGAIKFLSNSREAIEAYNKAVALEPDDPGAWNELGLLQFRLGNIDEAKNAWRTILGLDLQHDGLRWQAIATGNLGLVHRTRGELDKAEKAFEKARDLAGAGLDPLLVAAQHRNLAAIYRTLARSSPTLAARTEAFGKGEQAVIKALAIDKEKANEAGLSADYSMLGMLYRDEGKRKKKSDKVYSDQKFQKASAMFEAGLSAARARKLPEEIARHLHNIATMKLEIGEWPAAEVAAAESLKINESLIIKEGMASCQGTLGNVKMRQGKFEDALKLFLKAYEINYKLGRTNGLIRDHTAIANAYRALGKASDAKRHMDERDKLKRDLQQKSEPDDPDSDKT